MEMQERILTNKWRFKMTWVISPNTFNNIKITRLELEIWVPTIRWMKKKGIKLSRNYRCNFKFNFASKRQRKYARW